MHTISLNALKKAGLNRKVSVADILLELSKTYRIELGKTDVLSERSNGVRKLMKALRIENLITKKGGVRV